MKEIQSDYKDIFEDLLDSDNFIEGFFDCYDRS